VIVPGGFFPNPATLPASFKAQPSPFGVTFSGPAFSEPRLIGYAYAFEQATHHRVPSPSVPPLPSDTVTRR
jgi:amidase